MTIIDLVNHKSNIIMELIVRLILDKLLGKFSILTLAYYLIRLAVFPEIYFIVFFFIFVTSHFWSYLIKYFKMEET